MARRHALVIGIDGYPGFGPESQLFGAVRDAETMAAVLIDRHSFRADDVTRLLGKQATRGAILRAMKKLGRRARAGDQVVLYFSGHGSQMTDREGDEGDGLDETIVPFDSGRDGAENRDVTDDEINYWAAGVLEVTPHLTLIFDCCYGGTLQRPGWRVRRVPPDLRPVELLPPSPVPIWRDVETGARPLVATACRDDEIAVELPFTGTDRGAFSFHFIEALRCATPGVTWREIFARTASALAVDCPEQHPQLSGEGLDLPPFLGDRSRTPGHDAGHRLLDLAARPDRFGIVMELFRSRGGAWLPLSEPSFIEGDRLRVDLRHGHDRRLFVYLLDIGLTGRVTLLFPDPEGHEVLDSKKVVTVGARRGDALDLFVPDDLLSDCCVGGGHLVVVASERRLSTARLLSGSVSRDQAGAVRLSYRLRRA